LTFDPLKDDRLTYQKLPRYCHDHRLNLDDRLVGRLVLHLERHLELPHQRTHPRHLLDEVHQNHLGDLHLDGQHPLVQKHLGDLVRLDEVRRNHLDDHRLDDLVHLDEVPLDVVHLLLRHLDEVQHYRKKRDCFLRVADVALK
jgi:hypothetical protein